MKINNNMNFGHSRRRFRMPPVTVQLPADTPEMRRLKLRNPNLYAQRRALMTEKMTLKAKRQIIAKEIGTLYTLLCQARKREAQPRFKPSVAFSTVGHGSKILAFPNLASVAKKVGRVAAAIAGFITMLPR